MGLTTETWRKVFEDFKQVERVNADSSAERLDITISKKSGILTATAEELDNMLCKSKGNPHEAVTSFLKKHGVIVYYQNTLVAYFDIQAYSAFIVKTVTEKAIQKVSELFLEIKDFAETDFYAAKFDCWILSDSIIVVVDTNRSPLVPGSLQLFLMTCAGLMGDSMKAGFPLRGAIGGGDFYKDGEIMVSTGLVDAASYEKEQDWFGAVLTPNALEVIGKAKKIASRHENPNMNFDLSLSRDYVKFGKIPWKQEKIKEKPLEMHYIKPYGVASNDWETCLPEYFDKVKHATFNLEVQHHEKRRLRLVF